ncbi:MAG: hypothetical protein AMJ88_07825 [Anaerolineae bacterium SM23_ 63]|nr:MAG: hypothetical protein AMJ88_07825 [Anaerolineae bacterium SM23_ 63]
MSIHQKDNKGGRSLIESASQLIIAILITIVLISALVYWVKPMTILQLIRFSDLELVFLALLMYVIVFTLRVVRFHQFQDLANISFWKFLPIVSLHSFFTSILPFRSGEVALIYLLRKYHGKEVGTGVGVLLLVRMYDFVALALCLTGALVPQLISRAVDDTWLIFITIIFGVMILALSLTAASWWNSMVSIVHLIVVRIGLGERKWIKIVFNWATEVGSVLEKSSNLSRSIRLILTSVLVWLMIYCVFWTLLRSMGMSTFAFNEVIVATTGAALTNALPVNLIGGFGTVELGWMAGFSALGVAAVEGVATGFALHIWVLMFSMFLAIGSYLWLTIGLSPLRGRSDQRKGG